MMQPFLLLHLVQDFPKGVPPASNKIPKGISPEGGAEQNLPQDCSKILRKILLCPPFGAYPLRDFIGCSRCLFMQKAFPRSVLKVRDARKEKKRKGSRLRMLASLSRGFRGGRQKNAKIYNFLSSKKYLTIKYIMNI
jgi:hypothetical protein